MDGLGITLEIHDAFYLVLVALKHCHGVKQSRKREYTMHNSVKQLDNQHYIHKNNGNKGWNKIKF
jgi:hypothetical protein